MRALGLVLLVACGAAPPPIRLTEDWPQKCGGDYDAITEAYMRRGTIRGEYQEVMSLTGLFKSADWRAAHAARDADHRGLTGDVRAQRCAQAQAEASGPYEIELLVTTWDRRENDLDRGEKSVWHVVLVDEQGKEIKPLEIVKDKRPTYTMRSEFPTFGDFAIGYIARFPRDEALLGPNAHSLRLRMSGERGGVELEWKPSI
jgi:hypothetical protein